MDNYLNTKLEKNIKKHKIENLSNISTESVIVRNRTSNPKNTEMKMIHNDNKHHSQGTRFVHEQFWIKGKSMQKYRSALTTNNRR